MISKTRRIAADIGELLERGDGLVDVQTARAAQVSLDRLIALVDVGLMIKVASGVYASTATMQALAEWPRHLLIARAFARSCSPDAMITGWSAVPAWDLPVIGSPPRRPTVVRPKIAGLGPTTTSYGRVLVADVPVRYRSRALDVGAVSQGWAAADVARTGPVLDALVVVDAALRCGADVAGAVRAMSRWHGVGRARWVVDHADPNAESPLETLGRFACIQFCLPMPVSNAWVGIDRPRYRVDGLWPFHSAAFEADGAVKYNDRPDAARIVAKQSEREWELRRLGLDLARFGWDLAAYRRAELAERFTALLRDNPPRAEPIRWWKHVPGVGPVEPEPADWPSPYPTAAVLPAGWQHDVRRRR